MGSKLSSCLQERVPKHKGAVLAIPSGKAAQGALHNGHTVPKTAGGGRSCSHVSQQQQTRPQSPLARAQKETSTHNEALEKEKGRPVLRLNRALSRSGGSSRCSDWDNSGN